ncbi:MAG: hypothetical protein G01um101424_81 [Parcubacteria group bacterium Gr01-1014_24]|nr:MAG: hypothetical protein G01um101424_81 [Parcubacteria group bacterium Gr01-1014_24]
MVEGTALEKRKLGNWFVSSNLTSSASWENANLQRQARGARRAARIGFERFSES